MKPIIRSMTQADNSDVKALVVETLKEFGIAGAGFAGVDPELEDMHQAYSASNSAMYVIELAGTVLGMGGFASLAGTTPGTIAELRKMYFRPQLRGLGMGDVLIKKCLDHAESCGYHSIYLETVPAMKVAQKLYLKHGFQYIDKRLGHTGHGGCGVFMQKVFKSVD